MFKEEIEIIKNAFSHYFADEKYLMVLMVSLFVIIVELKRKADRRFLVYYPVLMFIIILNPVFCYILLKFVSQSVYYRLFWMIPLGIIIAYFGVILIFKLDKKISKGILCLFFLGMIAYSGTFVYSSTTFEKVNNWYKIPDEYIQVTQILGEIPLENKKAVTSTNMVGYIRQIDASIELAYGRRPYEDYQIYEIVNTYQKGDVENLTNLCKEQNTNIIVYDNSILLTISPSYYGYNLYAQTEHYDIYVLTEELLSDVYVDEETITIEGLKNEYKLCFVNDLHIIVPDEEVSEENKETVQQRYQEFFRTSIGESSSRLWKRLPSQINQLNPDLVVLGGDMIDYFSSSNIECLKSGMREIEQEIMYIRADHDYGTFYNRKITEEYIHNLEKSIDDNLEVYCKDLGEILVVGIDDNTKQISEKALLELKQIFAVGKPIILVTHVPFNSRIDNTLAEASKKGWQGRNLTWDETETAYIANDNTKEFLALIYAEESPVKAVLAGHLHFKNTTKLNQNITQYVFDVTYKGNIGVINIVGK